MSNPQKGTIDETVELRTPLSKDTLISLGLAITVLCAVAGGIVWLNTALARGAMNDERMMDKMGRVESDLRVITQAMNDGSLVSYRDLALWARLLQTSNPELAVPDPTTWTTPLRRNGHSDPPR